MRDSQAGTLPIIFSLLLPFMHPTPTRYRHAIDLYSFLFTARASILAKHMRKINDFFSPNHLDWKLKERACFSLPDLGFLIDLQTLNTQQRTPLPGSQRLRNIRIPHQCQTPHHFKKKIAVSKGL